MIRLIVLSIILLSTQLYSSPLELSHKVYPSTGYIGDHFSYELTATFNPGIQFIQPEIEETLGDFDVLTFEIKETAGDQENVFTLKYKLSPYKVGDLSIPSRNIQYKIGSSLKSVDLSGISMTISSLITEGTALNGQIEAWHMPGNAVLIALIFIIILIVGLVTYFLKEKYKKEAQGKTKKSHLSAKELALWHISKLEHNDLITAGKEKEHYSYLSEIIKDFLADALQQQTKDMTSHEIQFLLNKKQVEKGTVNRVMNVLEECDQVKFTDSYQDIMNPANAILKTKDIIDRIAIKEEK